MALASNSGDNSAKMRVNNEKLKKVRFECLFFPGVSAKRSVLSDAPLRSTIVAAEVSLPGGDFMPFEFSSCLDARELNRLS